MGVDRRWRVNTRALGMVEAMVRAAGEPVSADMINLALRQRRSKIHEPALTDHLNVLVSLHRLKRDWNGETLLYSPSDGVYFNGEHRRIGSGEQVETEPCGVNAIDQG